MKSNICHSQPKQQTVVRMQALMTDCSFETIQLEGSQQIYFRGISKGYSVINRMLGEDIVYDMLLRAVNNRTRERNYFRLYSQLLDESISEEEFNQEIDNNEDEYVVGADREPSEQEVEQALHLVPHIKDVHNSEDLSSLFSFDSERTEQLVKQIECNK